MLDEELWLNNISDKSGIDFDVSNRIFRTIVSYFDRILSHGKSVLISDIAYIRTILVKEYIAITCDDKYYLCPPYIRVCVEKLYDNNTKIEDAVFLFDENVISDLAGVNTIVVRSWTNAFINQIRCDVSSGKEVKIRDIMSISPIFGDEHLVRCDIKINDKLYARLNKAFSMFKVIEIFGYEREAFMLEENYVVSISDVEKDKHLVSFDMTIEKENDIEMEHEEDNSAEFCYKTEILKKGNIEVENTHITDTFNLRESNLKSTTGNNIIWYIVFILIIIGLCTFLWFVFFSSTNFKTNADKIEKVSREKNEKTMEQKTQSSDTIIRAVPTEIPKYETYDTIYIKDGDRLTLYSLKKYGHKVFWVYIYEENKNVISNPDNISIGTRIILPPASKYKINSKDNKSINDAFILEKEITKNKR